MKRRFLPLLLALLLALAGCGGRSGDTVMPTPSSTPSPSPAPAAEEFSLPRTGGSLHPILGTNRVNLTLAGLVWEGLFELDAAFTPQNVLCSTYAVSEDGLTWTFWLRSGVTFSDGTPLTPDDAVYSIQLAKNQNSRFAARLACVQGAKAENGGVVVRLNWRNGNLPALLNVPVVRGESEQPLGTGPYAVEGEGEDSALVARQDWWQKKALPAARIPLRIVPEADNLIAAFDTGTISMVTADLTGTSSLGYAGNYETWDYPTGTLLYVGFQTNQSSPCADGALRAALAHGFDRTTVAGSLYAWHAEAAALPVHPKSALYDAALAATLAYSPQNLAALLAEAGYEKNADGLLTKGRNLLTLDFLVNTDNAFRLGAAEYLAGELTKAGVTVNLKKLAWSDYQKALMSGNFDLYLGETVLTADFDPAALVAAGGALNFGKYADAETAQLLSAFQAASGDARKTAASALYAKLARDVPIAAIAFKNQSVLTQWGMVTGLAPTQQDPFYGIEHWNIR
ncbi:MAG: peptide ABC transporter substrate-binding protein [Clostridia bacterium]|nr:peptide ABC transporter substrate-binding protein [Clostridia bacterium]